MSKRPKRITIASVRAILKRYGCTIEESFSEFRVDPPAGMGFDLGELSQRVFVYYEDLPASDSESRRGTLEEIYDGAGAMAACLAPWRGDGSYQEAISEVLSRVLEVNPATVDLRHVEAWLLTDHDLEELSRLDAEDFRRAVKVALALTRSRDAYVNEARRRELGL